MPRPNRPRLAEVAKAAGVSLSTASRVLSGAGGASKAAIDAVLTASDSLGYRPDPVARALRAQYSGLAGIVVPGVSNPFFAELVEALENALRVKSFEMILADSRGSAEEEAHRLQTVVDRKVDGLVVIPTHRQASREALERAQRLVPVVQIDRHVDAVIGDFVAVDNESGIRLALDHLVQQGIRDVVFISDVPSSSTGRSRLEAFRLAVRETKGLKARSAMLGTFSLDFGRQAVAKLIDQRALPEGIVCGSDLIALGVVRELRRQSVAVPEEVAVTGFDGILFTELCEPPLTTLRQPVQEIAAEAVRLLYGRIGGDSSPPHRSSIAPVLEVRRSSLRAPT